MAILTAIGLRRGHTFVDVGCGEGFFALPAARMVGPRGAVFGIDINAAALNRLRESAEAEGLTQLHSILGKAEETIVCPRCAQVVFYGICLHDFRDPIRVLGCGRAMIREDGVLVDLDWKAEPTPLGPPLSIRFPVDKASTLIENAGFCIRSVKDAGPCHYCIRAAPR